MENGPFIDDFPIKTSIYKGFSIKMVETSRNASNINLCDLSVNGASNQVTASVAEEHLSR
jgi:hypothetical protein